MQVYQEIQLGRTKDREIFWGSLIGASIAAGAVYLVTVLVFSLA